MSSKLILSTLNYWWLKEWKEFEMGEDRYFRCPHPGGWVDAELVRDGFREWLRRTRRENPEKYAKLMSELQETSGCHGGFDPLGLHDLHRQVQVARGGLFHCLLRAELVL
jgi:hypothetical protein